MENQVRTNEVLKGMLSIVIASFLWGTTGTAAQFAPAVSPLAIGAFAMGIGGVLLCISARKLLVKDAPILFSTPLIFLFGSACVAIYPLAFYSSMRLSGVAIGTVVSIASAPLFAALLEYFLSKKPVSLKWFISFIFGVLGIGLLAMGKAEGASELSASKSNQIFGVILGLIAGLTYAGYSWAAKQHIDTGANSKSAMAGLFGCAAIVLLPSLWFTGQNLFANAIHTSVSLYMAVVPMFLGYLLFGYGLRTTEASKATLITLIEPLVATFFAIFLIGEVFKPVGWIGMTLVSLCLFIQSVRFSSPLKRLGRKATA
ncbi:EamA family transporter [Alteromonas sp. BL110]|uniref:DMT family transporter n=1 Tax=Alteromonas sp. BL110 TaxID=1714845 RepID=UPI000E49ED1E|nr:EamA family transporter [Alteromonas sp. BL110]AXT37867.1 EamA family transporter [Alteromonas sp. BL110]RKM80607.1 EamA family transporter [Alteromonas sp. BL110]